MPSLLGSSLKVPKTNDLAVPIQHVEDTDVVVFSPLLLTLGVHVQRGLRYLICVSVYAYSRTAGKEAAYERYQHL